MNRLYKWTKCMLSERIKCFKFTKKEIDLLLSDIKELLDYIEMDENKNLQIDRINRIKEWEQYIKNKEYADDGYKHCCTIIIGKKYNILNDIKTFNTELNILLKYSEISLSFIQTVIDSIQLVSNILYIVVTIAENFNDADNIPF